MAPSSLLSFLLLALSSTHGALAGPASLLSHEPRTPSKFTLGFSARVNATGFPNILKADQARAASFLSRGRDGAVAKRAGHIVDATNAVVTYTASVGVGSPATQYDLLIDTGSSNTWLGAGKAYVKTSTSKDTGDTVSVTYGSGSFSGNEFTDRVTLSPDLVIEDQSIGVSTTAQGFDGVDGIIGIGPVDLTTGTLSDQSKSIPTVTDSLKAQGKIDANLLGIFYQPTTDPLVAGELDFGAIDRSKATKAIKFVPVTQTSPASFFWGIDQTITYDGKRILKSSGITDTGTTLILLATDAFNVYQKATGAKPDAATGLLKISAANFKKLKNLVFTIGGSKFSLTPNGQIWPRALNTQIGGTDNAIYLIVADLGQIGGQGLDFINGFTWLQRFYTVYDTQNKQIGFAPTKFTKATTN